MKRLGMLAFLALLPLAGHAQMAVQFARFPAKTVAARAKEIDFRRSPGAWSFRTRLRAALKGGVNFAGHYILTGWGCGTGCIYGAVIDARSGRVYFPQQLAAMAVWYDDAGYTDEPVRYRKNSRLMVLSGVSGDQGEDAGEEVWGDYYYEWRNNAFRLVKFVRRPRTTG